MGEKQVRLVRHKKMRGTSRLVKAPIKSDSSECDIVVITEEEGEEEEEDDEDEEEGGKLGRHF